MTSSHPVACVSISTWTDTTVESLQSHIGTSTRTVDSLQGHIGTSIRTDCQEYRDRL